MQQRTLGSSFPSSAIGLGCMGFSQGYGPAEDSESVAAIHRALDEGITLLDTAMSYGAGHNESLIARALAGRPARAQVATKFGIVRDGGGTRLDAHPDRVRGYCEASLRRLGIETIDLYYLHRADPSVPIAETLGAMAELVHADLVRHLGVSEVTPAQLRQAAAVHPIAAVQFEWSLLWREPERDLIPAARALGIGLVPYSPMGRGLLTAAVDRESIAASGFRAADPRFQGENLDRNLRQVDALRAVASRLSISPGQLALAWLLSQGDDVVPIPGTRRADRVAENAAAAGLRLGPAELRQVDAAAPPGAWAGDRRSFGATALTRGGPNPQRLYRSYDPNSSSKVNPRAGWGRYYQQRKAAVGEESELQSKLRVHERKKLSVIEDALAPVSSGRSLTADAVPPGALEAIRHFWDTDSEPADLISEETGPEELAAWMEGQLARHGIGRNCYVFTDLSIKPWIGCVQTPGWTQTLRTVIPDPVILADDLAVVVGFLELEYHYASYAASLVLAEVNGGRTQSAKIRSVSRGFSLSRSTTGSCPPTLR